MSKVNGAFNGGKHKADTHLDYTKVSSNFLWSCSVFSQHQMNYTEAYLMKKKPLTSRKSLPLLLLLLFEFQVKKKPKNLIDHTLSSRNLTEACIGVI